MNNIPNFNDNMLHSNSNDPYDVYKNNLVKKARRRKKALKQALRSIGRSDAMKERERILLSNPTTRNNYTFTNPQNPSECQQFHGIEFTEYSAYPSQPIIHGVITVNEFDNEGRKVGETKDDLYFYQPRFEGQKGFALGPRYQGDKLNNNAAYAYRDRSTQHIFVGSLPKREVLTNRQFDFDGMNMNNFALSCQANLKDNNVALAKIVNIEYDKDPATGYIRTVNFEDANEYARYSAYVSNNTSATLNTKLNVLVQNIESQLVKAEKIESAMREAGNRLSMANNIAQREAAEASNNQRQQTSLADENARLINNMLRYGIRPSYASPMQNGTMPPPPPPGMPPFGEPDDYPRGPRR